MEWGQRAQIVRDDFVTAAFLAQPASSPESTSIARYLFDKLGSEKSDVKCRAACVIYTELDRKVAAIWLLIAIGLSTVGGVAAGVGGQNANLGFDVGTCVLAVLSGLQGVLFLWQI